jgi:hypothetical protein
VYVPPTELLIVGTATLPAIGGSQTFHTSMGTGAMIPIGIEPPAFQNFLHSPDPTLNGPNMVLVRFAPASIPKRLWRDYSELPMRETRHSQLFRTAAVQEQASRCYRFSIPLRSRTTARSVPRLPFSQPASQLVPSSHSDSPSRRRCAGVAATSLC